MAWHRQCVRQWKNRTVSWSHMTRLHSGGSIGPCSHRALMTRYWSHLGLSPGTGHTGTSVTPFHLAPVQPAALKSTHNALDKHIFTLIEFEIIISSWYRDITSYLGNNYHLFSLCTTAQATCVTHTKLNYWYKFFSYSDFGDWSIKHGREE